MQTLNLDRKKIFQEKILRISTDLDLWSIPELPEKRCFKSLFMNEEESDVKFKIQDKIIPAHKQLLIEKSRYFANLFNSNENICFETNFFSGGMSESRQEIIEIPDCDHLLFQEFLRFLYYDEVKKDEHLAMELFIFADKYVQKDLREKCSELLKWKINSDNVYKILDFAIQENIASLQERCLHLLGEKVNTSHISELIEYLGLQNNPEDAKGILELRDKAFNFVLKNYLEISKGPKTSSAPYENFLINSIAFDKVADLGKFVSGQDIHIQGSCNLTEQKREDLREKEVKRLERLTANLKFALVEFIQTNFRILQEEKILKQLPSIFLADLLVQAYEEAKPSNDQNTLDGKQKKTKKSVPKKPRKERPEK